MNTTITEFKVRSCIKCGGAGFLSAFQHRKGGECFRCGASGYDPVMVEVSREMTDDEVLAAMDAAGFPVVFIESPRVIDEDNYLSMFLTDAEAAARAATFTAARSFLAAI